jgi:hypothetical protein
MCSTGWVYGGKKLCWSVACYDFEDKGINILQIRKDFTKMVLTKLYADKGKLQLGDFFYHTLCIELTKLSTCVCLTYL